MFLYKFPEIDRPDITGLLDEFKKFDINNVKNSPRGGKKRPFPFANQFPLAPDIRHKRFFANDMFNESNSATSSRKTRP